MYVYMANYCPTIDKNTQTGTGDLLAKKSYGAYRAWYAPDAKGDVRSERYIPLSTSANEGLVDVRKVSGRMEDEGTRGSFSDCWDTSVRICSVCQLDSEALDDGVDILEFALKGRWNDCAGSFASD